MSFGFSAGDFVAVGKLITDISSCLQDVGGSKEDYQELLRELQCLQQPLQHLDRLHNTGAKSASLDSIKYAALSCRHPLEQFLGKIQKYDKSLGVWSKDHTMKSTTYKVRWALSRKEEVRKMQGYLNIHVGTINILLAEHGLEKMELACNKADTHYLDVKESFRETRRRIGEMVGRLTSQGAVVRNIHAMLMQLSGLINGEFQQSWRSFGAMVAKVCVVTQQSYTVLLEIQSSLPGPDPKLTYFQAPLAVEDALGFKFPVPSEYDFDLLDAVIKKKFDAGPGSLDVRVGNYEYFKTKNSKEVLSRESRLLPGTAVTMAMIVVVPTLTDETCPMPKCRSPRTSECPGGGKLCCECNVWFSPATKTRIPLDDLAPRNAEDTNSPAAYFECDNIGSPRKRQQNHSFEDSMNTYKNVRLSRTIPFEDHGFVQHGALETMARWLVCAPVTHSPMQDLDATFAATQNALDELESTIRNTGRAATAVHNLSLPADILSGRRSVLTVDQAKQAILEAKKDQEALEKRLAALIKRRGIRSQLVK